MKRDRHHPGRPSPEAVHNTMLEAAYRVAAVLTARVASGNVDDPMFRALSQLGDSIASVAINDLSAQRVMTDRLRHLHQHLLDDPQHHAQLTVVAWRKVTGTVLPVPRPCTMPTVKERGNDDQR